MKKLLFAVIASATFMACNSDGAKPATTANEAAAPEKSYDYPYKVEKFENWTPGDQQHVVTAMAALKAFSENDINACVANFGDSIKLAMDGYEATLSNDSLKAYFTKVRGQYTSVEVKMDDFESVISKDKKTEVVSLWYKEIFTTPAGVTDSIECMNDIKIEGGKLAGLSEKSRKYMKK